MRKSILYILIFVFTSGIMFSQVEESIWDKQKVIDNEFCKFKVPMSWKERDIEAMGQIVILDGSGVGIPTFYNGAPIIVTLILRNLNANSLEAAKDSVVASYTANELWAYQGGLKYTATDYETESGDKVMYMEVRNYWARLNLFQTQYSLVSYNPTKDVALEMIIRFQHYDKKYTLEDRLQISSMIDRIFSTFTMKK